MSLSIEPGRRVSLHFTLSLTDGTVVETTRDANEPLEFVLGDGTLLENLEAVLEGMCQGDKRSVQLSPEAAFGYSDPESVQHMPRSQFAAEMALEPGMVVGFNLPTGEEVPGTIVEISEDIVTVDFSHPLVNRDLVFEVEVLDVTDG